MIVRAYPYGGSNSDAAQLSAYLLETKNQRPKIVESRNIFVPDTLAGLGVMRCFQRASKAKIAFWHIVIAPPILLNKSNRELVFDEIIAELAAHDHPLIALSHGDRPRARLGGAGTHLHALLGHISPTTRRALNMRHYLPRLHKAAAVASFKLGCRLLLSPYHCSIVKFLRAEGRPAIAQCLVDSLGESPRLRPPRMTDPMRRSAAAADFNIARFQAAIEKLWWIDAPEPDFINFLSEFGVAINESREAGRSPFYRGELFLGTLHRILQLSAPAVYLEATIRFPNLFLGQHKIDTGVASLPGHAQFFPVPAEACEIAEPRELDLERQSKADSLELRLAFIRRELRRIEYDCCNFSDNGSKPDFIDASSIRPDWLTLDELRKAEPILERAIQLLWQDERWISAPIERLLDYADSQKESNMPITTFDMTDGDLQIEDIASGPGILGFR
jgi:hypothetical protein